MTVSDAIRTLDFSLPAYDSISSSKASVETVEGLSQEYAQKKEPAAAIAKKRKEPKVSSGSNPMASMLPSMNKSNTKASKPKPAPAARAPPKEKEERAPAVKTMDLSLPSYSDEARKEKSIFSI